MENEQNKSLDSERMKNIPKKYDSWGYKQNSVRFHSTIKTW